MGTPSTHDAIIHHALWIGEPLFRNQYEVIQFVIAQFTLDFTALTHKNQFIREGKLALQASGQPGDAAHQVDADSFMLIGGHVCLRDCLRLIR